MEKNVDEAARARNAARGALVAEREARREGLAAMREGAALVPGGKLARRMAPVLLDEKRLADWVGEHGGDEGFLRWLCGQVAARVSVTALCGWYAVNEGALGAWLAEVPERLAMYRRAQAWAAEGLVDQALDEAWDDGVDVVRSKLRVQTNLQVAGKYNRAMYGEEKQTGVTVAPVINFVMGGGEPLPVAVQVLEPV